MKEHRDVPGLWWHDNGQSALTGELLERFRELDEVFVRLASKWQAVPILFPPLVAVSELAKIAYFESFPQLFTAATGLAAGEGNLRQFTSAGPVRDGALALTELAPVREILTPAACYPLYIAMQGREMNRRGVFTVRSQCFRREREFIPLRRQWAFTMREIVCIGSGSEVREFLEEAKGEVDRIVQQLDLQTTWEIATDPFFDPRNPQALMQRVDPVKRELTCDQLAIGSINYHRHHFGDAFAIRRGSESVESGCVAFGLERWLDVLIRRHGTTYLTWPRFDAVRFAE